MLIVMKHWDAHALAQLTLNDKALGCFDVLKIDATESGFQARNDFNEFLGILFIDLDIKHINTGELLK